MAKEPVSNRCVGDGVSGKPAVIYCRSARLNQSGPCEELDAQEARCRSYADQRGLTVLQVYKEQASGVATERPALNAMLSFLNDQSGNGVVVIVDDISRLARSLALHHTVRAAISDAGGVIETPSLAVGGNATSSLIENVLVSLAAYRAPKDEALP